MSGDRTGIERNRIASSALLARDSIHTAILIDRNIVPF
jgi:hypothetical protein